MGLGGQNKSNHFLKSYLGNKINMNNVPNDILGVTKLFKRIISHTTPWSHKNQALYVLKQ